MRNHEKSTPNMYYTCASTLMRPWEPLRPAPSTYPAEGRLQSLHIGVCFAGNVVPKFQGELKILYQ